VKNLSEVDPSTICIYARDEGCRVTAEVHVFCSVEGRDTHFCTVHWGRWSRQVAGDEALSKHCPRCAGAFIARREAEANNPAITIASEPIRGPLADAIDKAMHAEGVLGPTRRAVLLRLAADTDAYVAAVMARSGAAIV
jgi:hypothetical protein